LARAAAARATAGTGAAMQLSKERSRLPTASWSAGGAMEAAGHGGGKPPPGCGSDAAEAAELKSRGDPPYPPDADRWWPAPPAAAAACGGGRPAAPTLPAVATAWPPQPDPATAPSLGCGAPSSSSVSSASGSAPRNGDGRAAPPPGGGGDAGGERHRLSHENGRVSGVLGECGRPARRWAAIGTSWLPRGGVRASGALGERSRSVHERAARRKPFISDKRCDVETLAAPRHELASH